MIPDPAIGVFERILADPDIASCVSRIERLPEAPGSYSPLPPGLDGRIAEALARKGIDRLYTHQRASWDLARAGRDFVVVTPTASGKTLCYNLPVVQALLEDPVRTGPLPVPDQGPVPGPAGRAERGRPGRRPSGQDRHLRRRHSLLGPRCGAGYGAHRHHESRHAPFGGAAQPRQVDELLRRPALRRRGRDARIPRAYSAAMSPT